VGTERPILGLLGSGPSRPWPEAKGAVNPALISSSDGPGSLQRDAKFAKPAVDMHRIKAMSESIS
jgi:hypothetical protein